MRDRREFARVAPRLERAHRERRDELATAARDRARARATMLRLQALVAHRELQVIRAGVQRGGRRRRARYLAHRTNLLDQARRDLRRVEAVVRRLDA